MPESYQCWKCGGPLQELLLPLARHEECPHCRTRLHVHRMCVYFDTSAPQQCREPVAEQVADKQRANFCSYFQVNPRACTGSSDQAVDSRRQPAALFWDWTAEDGSWAYGTEDELRKQLEQ